MSKATTLTAAYRWSVAARVAAAALGGYTLASAATVLLALLWPAPMAQGVLWSSMLSFTIYTVAVIWVFCARSVAHAWAGMAIGTAVCAGLAWLLMRGGA